MDYCIISVDRNGNITTLVECLPQAKYKFRGFYGNKVSNEK